MDDVTKGLAKADRGKLIMACGTGKTFTALRIAEKLAPSGHVLFLVPSLSLMSQSLREWTAEAAKPIRSLAVCSDVNIGMLAELAREAGANDALVAEIAESVTARRVLELCDRHGLPAVPKVLCERVVRAARRHSGRAYPVEARLMHFDGTPIASACSEEISDE